MHILIIPSWYPRSDNQISGTFFRAQALALSSAGFKVGVISPQLRSVREIVKLNYSVKKGINVYNDSGVVTYCIDSWNWSFKLNKFRERHWLLLGKELFKKYLTERGVPDVIHAHCSLFAGSLAHELKKEYKIPFVVTEHSTRFARGLLNCYEKKICASVFEESSANIAVSFAFAELLSNLFPSVKRTWVWVPNLLSPIFENLSPIYTKKLCQVSQSGKGNDSGRKTKFRFLNVGILTAKKGQDHLVRAFLSAFGNESHAELAIGGDGPMKRKIEKLVEEYELQSSVFLLGSLKSDEVLEEMFNADAFVLSSHYETFGVVLIEALACGKPVIATSCGGPECIVTNQNGLLIERSSTKQMAKALRYMQSNVDQYDSRSIRKECLSNFGSTNIVKMLERIYYDAVHTSL